MLHKISPKRRIVCLISTLVFIICSLITLFFAFGYRFNYQHKIVIHSGTITIKSTPEKVSIHLNGEEIDKKSYDIINDSYNVTGVKPGSYLLEVKSPGYSTWKKTIDIHSGIATEFWNIVLTPHNPAFERLDIVSPLIYKVSENGAITLYANRVHGPLNVFVFSKKSKTSQKIFEEEVNRKNAINLSSIEFSPDNKNALLKFKEGSKFKYALVLLEDIKKNGPSGTNFIYLNPPLSKAVALNPTSKEKARDSLESKTESANKFQTPLKLISDASRNPNFFDKTEISDPGNLFGFYGLNWLDNKNFYFMNQGNLYLASMDKEEVRMVLENIRGYRISQEKIFYVKPPENLIFKANCYGENRKQITNNLIDQDFDGESFLDYRIIIYDDERLALINPKDELYLHNNNDREYQVFKKISERVKGVQFSDDGKKLLYFNEDQIKVYYLREWDVQPKNDIGSNITIFENNKEKIQDAMWYFNYQHITFSLGSRIMIVELDERGGTNKSLVIKTDIGKPDFALNFQARTLFFLEKSDKFNQLFEIKIPKR